MNALEKRAIASLASVYAMRMLGLFMVLPVFALLGSELSGATPALTGLAIGAYGLTQALLQVPFGLLSDRLGRKPLIYVGLVIFAAGSLLAGASDSIYGVIAGRALQGAGAIASVLMALLSDLTREEQRTKAMATVGITIGLSFSLSLIVGPLVASVAGLAGLFYFTALLATIALGIVRFLVPEPVAGALTSDHLPVRAMLGRVLTDSRLLRLDFGIFALHLVLTALFLLVPVLLTQELGLPAERHWWFYLTIMVTSFFAMVPFIIIGEKYRKMKPVLSGAVALLIAATLAGGHLAAGCLAGAFLLFHGVQPAGGVPAVTGQQRVPGRRPWHSNGRVFYLSVFRSLPGGRAGWRDGRPVRCRWCDSVNVGGTGDLVVTGAGHALTNLYVQFYGFAAANGARGRRRRRPGAASGTGSQGRGRYTWRRYGLSESGSQAI